MKMASCFMASLQKVCPCCLKEFVSAYDTKMYCSSICKNRARARRKEAQRWQRKKKRPTVLECQACGMWLIKKPRKNAPVYCNNHRCRFAVKSGTRLVWSLCRICHSLERTKAERDICGLCETVARLDEAKNEQKKRSRLVGCYVCGALIQQKKLSFRRRFCSLRCRRRVTDVTSLGRRKISVVEPIPIAYLIKRDCGICQICGRKVNLAVSGRHPDGPTTDHIVPISRGGQHVKENVQLAHNKCNASKRDRIGYQMRLLG